ncbi:MAG: hypothetical protein MUP97_14910, partial [Acidimicrobiia bacterium]|nr:hypothetical protein [Acidimicrobiia bacterium]
MWLSAGVVEAPFSSLPPFVSLAAACRFLVSWGEPVRRELRVSTTSSPRASECSTLVGISSGVGFGALRDAVGVVRGFVRDLDPGRVGARDAKELIELLGEAGRLCGGGVTLLAPRVADTKVWADDGAR